MSEFHNDQTSQFDTICRKKALTKPTRCIEMAINQYDEIP